MLKGRLWVRILIHSLPLILFALVGCKEEPAKQVNLANRSPLPVMELSQKNTTLKLAIGSIITPEKGYVYYQRLVDYLAKQLALNITVVDPGSYAKINQLLEEGQLDLAFVCSGPYAEGHDRFGLYLLASPVVHGEAAYYSDLIVPKESPAQSLADLRGQSFAFTVPESNSGCMVPLSKLAEMGTTAEEFFASFIYTQSHDRSILAVQEGMVQGAAVDSLIWDYFVATQPELADQIRVIARYGPYGSPPVVAAPHLPPELRQRIQQILFDLPQTAEGEAILQGMHVERFILIGDSAYDSVRQLQNSCPAEGL